MKRESKYNSMPAWNRITAVVAVLLFFLISCAPAEILKPDEAQELLSGKTEKPAIIDLREVTPFISGHIKGADNIPYNPENFQQRVSGYDKKKPVFIYCGKGLKTEEAAELLKNSGFKKIYSLEGGFESWKNEGYEISK
jgi:rhodanese-related sulfurtransferase